MAFGGFWQKGGLRLPRTLRRNCNSNNKYELIDCIWRVLAKTESIIAQNPQTSKACLVFGHFNGSGKWNQ